MTYRTNDLPLPAATPVPWRCRWFGHDPGVIIPYPLQQDGEALKVLQRCTRCKKWRRLDTAGNWSVGPWLEFHEAAKMDS